MATGEQCAVASTHRVDWVSSGCTETHATDPDYPTGRYFDLSAGWPFNCQVELSYPAPGCGHYRIDCPVCGGWVEVGTHGVADDPKAIRMVCRIAGRA